MKIQIQRADRSGLYQSEIFIELKKIVAERLKIIRQERQLTQEAAAHECGLGVRLYQSIEACEANLTLLTVSRLVQGLQVSASELFESQPKKKKR